MPYETYIPRLLTVSHDLRMNISALGQIRSAVVRRDPPR
jgi:hypothetical protein